MRKYTLGDHPEITLDFYADNGKFFGHAYKGNMPDSREKIKEVVRKEGKIIVIGVNYARYGVTTDNTRLDKIEHILKDYIGAPIKDIETIEID